jgi:glycosyltransferase involved in cell wall biosynthesis
MVRAIKPRILMLSITPFKGGGETHDAKLAELLIERYEVRAIVSNPWLQDQMVRLGISVTRINSTTRIGRYLLSALAIFRECLVNRPSAVHLNGQGEAYFAPIFRLLKVKSLIARHAPLNAGNNRLKQFVVNTCYRFGTKIICVSTLVRRDMETIVCPQKLVTIPNWLKDSQISVSRRYQASDKDFRLLFVGRLVQFKGAADLIEAMRNLDGCTLEIVGDGPDRKELLTRASGLAVTFVGLVDDCTSFYDGADLFVFPSYPSQEGQGQTPLEAMARGLPCLVSDIEVAKETTDDGKVAGVFRHGDVEDLAHQIAQMRNPELLTRLSQAGILRVKDHYSTTLVRTKYFTVLDEMMR